MVLDGSTRENGDLSDSIDEHWDFEMVGHGSTIVEATKVKSQLNYEIGFLTKSVSLMWLWPVYEPLRLVSPIFRFQIPVFL